MLTIFTPSYNRARQLPRLYKSLLEQSRFDFEWLIVDDGSSDDTAQVVQTFTGDGKFPVRYCYKENGGKHTAYNLALEQAAGQWFFCVDSDDYLAPGAVADILEAVAASKNIQGLIAYKQTQDGTRLSGRFPDGVSTCKMHELSMKYGCGGEFSLVFATSLAKKYPFPVFAGERFVTESVVYDRIDREAQLHLLPRVLTVCEYQADGYSQNANAVMKKNPTGYCLYFLQRIDLQRSFAARVIHAGKYWGFRWISKNKTLRYEGKHKALVALAVIPGILFRVYYKLFRKI